MQYNLTVVFDCDKSHVLMCRRRKNPYRGLLNFIGGKIEEGENHTKAAYRELREETSILKKDILLVHVMDLTYPLEGGNMEVYAGILNDKPEISGTENELFWMDVREDFSDLHRFAGCGNIYHIMNYIQAYKAQIINS